MLHTNYTLHYAKMEGLVGGRTYFYRLGCPGPAPGLHSNVISFNAFPPVHREPIWAAYGDLGVGVDAFRDLAPSIPVLAEEVGEGVFDGIIHAGDYAYDFAVDQGRRSSARPPCVAMSLCPLCHVVTSARAQAGACARTRALWRDVVVRPHTSAGHTAVSHVGTWRHFGSCSPPVHTTAPAAGHRHRKHAHTGAPSPPPAGRGRRQVHERDRTLRLKGVSAHGEGRCHLLVHSCNLARAHYMPRARSPCPCPFHTCACVSFFLVLSRAASHPPRRSLTWARSAITSAAATTGCTTRSGLQASTLPPRTATPRRRDLSSRSPTKKKTRPPSTLRPVSSGQQAPVFWPTSWTHWA